jgi:spermidine synthase
MLRFALTIFLSAFLLFQVQPMIGKYILPWFGGTIGVWTTCMLFFQLVLLAGYFYAHLLGKLAWKRQGMIHLILLGVALCFLPIEPSTIWKPTDGNAPTMRILMLLAATIGVPYMLLSSTGPLLQNWFSASYPGRSPYRLYSLSNVGSLLALVSFPIVVETNLSRTWQVRSWSIAFGAFVLCCAWCAWGMIKRESSAALGGSIEQVAGIGEPSNAPPSSRGAGYPSVGVILMWLLLSASGSAMLLATTNQLTSEVAVVPFLWVIPLALYLVTFIICFDNEKWYSRTLFGGLALFTIPVAIVLLYQGVNAKLWIQIAGYCACMFAVCMTCHGELVKSKPDPRHLTLFYLLISAGGALGGLCVAVLAPLLLNGYYEYHIALQVAVMMTAIAWFRSSLVAKPPYRASVAPYLVGLFVALAAAAAVLMLTVDPAREVGATALSDLTKEGTLAKEGLWRFLGVWREYFHLVMTDKEEYPYGATYLALPAGVVGLLLLSFMTDRLRASWKIRPMLGHATLTLTCMALAAALFMHLSKANEDSIFTQRNFYGVLHVEEDKKYAVSIDDGTGKWISEDLGLRHRLVHGRIMHGFQFMQEPQRHWPTSYYGQTSGLGLALEEHPRRLDPDPKNKTLNIGSIGLGCGTTASYARKGDRLRIYEINPAVDAMSGVNGEWFYYVKDASKEADVKVLLGDARVTLERQLKESGPEMFDVLAVDAFSSDSIPVHLLTKECAELYFQHLKPDGILALHISNRFINLERVTYALGREFHCNIIQISNSSDHDKAVSSSTWVLLTKNEEFTQNPAVQYDAEPWKQDKLVTAGHLKTIRHLEDDENEAIQVGDKNEQYVESLLWTDDFANLWDLLQFGG